MLQQLNTPKPRGLKHQRPSKPLLSQTPLKQTPLQKRLLTQTIKKQFKVYQEEQETSHESTEDLLSYLPEEQFEIDDKKVYPKFNFMTEAESLVVEEMARGKVEYLEVDLMPIIQSPQTVDLEFEFDDNDFSALF